MTDNILNWEQIDDSSFSTSNIYTIATDGITWVATSTDKKLATSINGISWTQRTSSLDFIIRNMVNNGTIWVGVGDGGKIATATDPTGTWTLVADSSFDTTSIKSIATDGTTWVAVGESGKLATATDPTGTWTQRTTVDFQGDFSGIATDGTIWVIVGNSGKTATATDPTGTWTLLANSGLDSLNCVVATKRNWVGVGWTGKLFTSIDPTSIWTQRTSSFGTTNIWSIATNGITWVAVGESGKMAINTGDIKESFPMFLPNLK